MRVKIRLFARLRDIAGASELDWETPGPTIAEVWASLVGRYPDLAPYASSLSCAHNEEYASMSAVLQDGDEVAFLPPVSGGAHARARVRCARQG